MVPTTELRPADGFRLWEPEPPGHSEACTGINEICHCAVLLLSCTHHAALKKILVDDGCSRICRPTCLHSFQRLMLRHDVAMQRAHWCPTRLYNIARLKCSSVHDKSHRFGDSCSKRHLGSQFHVTALGLATLIGVFKGVCDRNRATYHPVLQLQR